MPNTARRWLTLLGVVWLAACEQGPVAPPLDIGSDGPHPEADELVAAAVGASWDLLVTEEAVHLAVLEALEAQPNPDAEALLLESGDLGIEVAVAAAAGDVASAQTFAGWADDAQMEAALVVLGAGFADQAVTNVESALAQVDAALSTSTDGPSLSPSGPVDLARQNAQRARSELGRGNDVDALRAAMDAADDLRHVDPERRAKAYVEKALRLLGKAQELAGPDARPEILEILREAEAHCDAAVRALDTGNWALAVEEAQHCAALARRVIGLLSGGVGDDRLEERAKALVAQAEDLYHRAVELAGPDPSFEIQRALDEAFELLRLAEEALEDEDWREAIRLARESIAISRRVIGFLSDDRPDGLEARAAHAIQYARDLLVRAEGLAGDPPRPEIQDQLARARSHIADAETAFANGDYRRAIAKAQEAIAILSQVIRALS